MNTLISCREIAKSHGHRTLFEGLSLHINPKDRIGLIGANGSGKTSLLSILAGVEPPDEGERMVRRGLKIGWIEQEPDFESGQTAEQSVEAALMAADPEGEIDPAERRALVGASLGRLGFAEPEQLVGELSGGWQKRLAIARALVIEPELMLLDEPTNQLDLAGILWLEDFLSAASFACVVVTHDRTFLQRVTRRMIEIDPRHPDGILQIEGDYATFLEKRAVALQARAKEGATLANKVRREVEWLRRGPKARTSKSHARIQTAEVMIADLQQMKTEDRRLETGFSFDATGRKTRRLLVAKGIGCTRGGRRLFSGLDLLLKPGLRIGLVGGNGAGKTSLLKVLGGELEPTEGSIKRAEGLRVVTFEQQRESLDPDQSLRQALAGSGDQVIYAGRPIHVVGWARRFGFRSEQIEMKVGRLSGGEQAKAAIARLVVQPADLLMLDEPTNDLDIQTLEVLESSLLQFPGAVVLVTHDRLLLDRVADLLLGLSGAGQATLLADSAQWEAWIREPSKTRAKAKKVDPRKARKRKPGLSYLDQREFESMEAAILAAEETLEQARAAIADPAVAADAQALQERQAALESAEAQVKRLYARWAQLDTKRQGLDEHE
jgi:ATP-binding cassette subfamily F protein uup